VFHALLAVSQRSVADWLEAHFPPKQGETRLAHGTVADDLTQLRRANYAFFVSFRLTHSGPRLSSRCKNAQNGRFRF
jgi:hypothetical protein